MHILVFNSGSSSLKFGLFEILPAGDLCCAERGSAPLPDGPKPIDHAQAALAVLEQLGSAGSLDQLVAVGHRVVHGGEAFSEPVRIDESALAKIAELGALAPLHNPSAVAVMRACVNLLGPQLPMVAAFDTMFFHDLPEPARMYALPAEWARRGIRRYGFHGLAHRYLYQRCLEIEAALGADSRIITLQLGHGCSVAAIRGGRPMETSMGFTPLEGLIMSTRPGDLDAGALLYLAAHGLTQQELEYGINHGAGLLGLSGVSAEMDELLKLEADGHAGASLAVEAFCHRARKYLGAYCAVLDGADAIVFGGGIGENAPPVRARICAGLAWAGLKMDADANGAAVGRESRLSAADSTIPVYVLPVDEELIIARETQDCLAKYSH
jgi:acetate kinase